MQKCFANSQKPGQQVWFKKILHVVSIVAALRDLSVPGQRCKSSLNITTLTAPDTFCSSRRWWLPHVWGLGGKTHSPHSHSARSRAVYKLSSLAFGLVKLYEVSIFLGEVGSTGPNKRLLLSWWRVMIRVRVWTDFHCLILDKSGSNKQTPFYSTVPLNNEWNDIISVQLSKLVFFYSHLFSLFHSSALWHRCTTEVQQRPLLFMTSQKRYIFLRHAFYYTGLMTDLPHEFLNCCVILAINLSLFL